MSNTPAEQNAYRPAMFAVDDVTPTNIPLVTEPLSFHVSKRFNRKFLLLDQPEKLVTNSSLHYLKSLKPSDSVDRLMTTASSKSHPLVEAVATAFSQHRPLTLTPDAIWLTIEQGFAQHIAENAETYRHRMVRHQGKRELTAEVPDLNLASFAQSISTFSSKIRQETDPVLYETLLCDFSTTTPTIRTASEVVLMDCYSPFFAYSMMCVCGIPRVTVTGTVQDWQRIRSRIEVLETFDLSWWTQRLRPILDQFIQTVEGVPDLDFWQAIYKPKKSYGPSAITGWLTDLFPYLNAVPTRRRNPVLESPREDWALTLAHGVSDSRFPAALAAVPLQLKLQSIAHVDSVELVAGFFAVEQDPHDLALTPLIGWAIAEPASKKPIYL